MRPLQKSDYFSPISSLFSTHISHNCDRRCMPVAWNFLLKRRRSSYTLCFSSSWSAKWLSRSIFFRGPKSWKFEGAKSRFRGYEEEQSIPSCTDWLVVWHCHTGRGIDSFPSLKFPNSLLWLLCTYCSEFIVAPLSRNSINKIHCPSRG